MKTLLIVDDDESIRLLLREEFTDAGYNVITAVDGDEALVTFFEQYPDIVVLDMKMPKVGGWEVLEKLKAKVQDIPVIIYTANPDMVGDTSEFRKVEVIYKSYDLNQLIDTVNKHANA